MEDNLVVDAIKIQDVNCYLNCTDDNLKYFTYYVDCPYCKTKNDLGMDKSDYGYYICGHCSKVFYLR